MAALKIPASAAASHAIAEELIGLLGTRRQIATFSSRHASFSLADAYECVEITRSAREERGEKTVGRKIGFTNTTIWEEYGVTGPLWNYMYDSTVHDLAAIGRSFALAGLPEPRIEPEIALHLAQAPNSSMDDDALLGCIDWISHGFEIVQSVFPGWVFAGTDAAAAFGLHGALLLGHRHKIASDRGGWKQELTHFTVGLARNGHRVAQGQASNVLGGPVQALRFLLCELDKMPPSRRLRPGEIVTTGTLTQAMPVQAGETWTTDFAGSRIKGEKLLFA